jgi:FkbH-like protein/FkbM family methyltransferase
LDFFTLVDLLRWRATQQPDRHAYTFLSEREPQETRLTYAQLDAQARAIAATLQQQRPVAGERALLLYPPGMDFVAAFFGCLYAGVIAVPAYPPQPTRLDRTLPRLRAIVRNAQPTMVLTTAAVQSAMEPLLAQDPHFQRLRCVATDAVDGAAAQGWQAPAIAGESLAFLQFTSGSTAAPKGVMVSHGNLLHNERMIQQAFGNDEASVVAGWLPLYHDMGLIGNVLQPLYLGTPCVLMSPVSFLQSPLRWLQAITQYRATTSGGPNFAYDLCTRKITAEQRAQLDLSSWRVAFNGAEPVRHDTMERFAEAFAPCGFRREAFYPCYGLAEATLFVTGRPPADAPVFHDVLASSLQDGRVAAATADAPGAQTLVSSGRAWMDQQLLIVDPASAQPCADDQVGEIWVAGPSVAQGYWNQPEETARTFQARLADGSGPFLRTGDLGFLRGGELFVTGRLKDLIIIRGRNHYPQDIELSAERSHRGLRPGCGAAFSVDVDGEERLVVVQEIERQPREPDLDELSESIRQAVAQQHELQVYAVVLIKTGSIPKTSSGKIQRHACKAGFLKGELEALASSVLDASAAAEPEAELVLDRAALLATEPGERAQRLAAYLRQQVAQALHVAPSRVHPDQPLTALGLDSLAAVELKNRIEDDFDVPVPMAGLLEDISLMQLVARVTEHLESPARAARDVLVRADAAGAQPLSSYQQRLWVLDQIAPGSPAYNVPAGYRLSGALDTGLLQRCFNAVVRRHDALRTTFALQGGQPVQSIAPALVLPLPVHDLRALPEAEREAQRDKLVLEQAQRPFALAEGPLLRTTLLRLADDEHLLLLTAHHIVCDLWSMVLLVQEVVALYGAWRTAPEGVTPTPLAELPVQYPDFARWQRQWLQGPAAEEKLAYWKRQLAGAPALLELPLDHPRPPAQSHRGAHRFFDIPAQQLEVLRAFSRGEGATVFMTLLAAFKALLARATGQADVVVGSTIGGRTHPETERLIGLFADLLVLRTDLSGDPSFRDALARVREVALGAYAHQEVPFDRIVEAVRPERTANYTPFVQVMFSFIKTPLARTELPGVTLQHADIETGTTDFDLFLTVVEGPDGLHGSVGYNTDLFEPATIDALIEAYRAVVVQCVMQPDTQLGALKLPAALTARAARARPPAQRIAVTASFTAEPLEESLNLWMEVLDTPATVEFAPYNQVFQQLLDPSSLLARNQRGANVVLLRLEDWLREDKPRLEPAVSPEEQERLLAGKHRHRLPNGAEIAHLNKSETDFLYQEIFVDGVYARHGITLHDGDCVIDVGANIGLFTLWVHQQCRNARVFAFEPIPSVFELLKANSALYGADATLFQCGVSDAAASAKFTYYPNYSIMSGLHADAQADQQTVKSIVLNTLSHDAAGGPGASSQESVTRYVDELLDGLTAAEIVDVELRSLSSVIREQGIERIDLLKLDAEKSEWNVLQGIDEEDWPKIRQIVMEIHDADGVLRDRIMGLLAQKGFQCAIEQDRSQAGLYNVYARHASAAPAADAAVQAERRGRIERNAHDLVAAVKAAAARSATPHLVCLCPPADAAPVDTAWRLFLQRTEHRIAQELAGVPGVSVVTPHELDAAYPVANYYDAHGDALGHIPYTELFFAALGSTVARKLHALRNAPYKVIVLDADNTLWKGVVGEDGPMGVEIDAPRRALQEFVVAQHDAGMLVCVCSKNSEEDVAEVFARRTDMPLQREHIVAWRVNWNRKSDNLRALAKDLDLGLDSFIFIDDNPVECAEIRAACPEVLTLALPEDPLDIPAFLKRVWAFDRVKTTEEDRRRTALYRQNMERERFRREAVSLSDFLAGLGLEVRIAPVAPAQLPRVAQLTQRTNQFNTTGVKRSEAEIAQLCASAAALCLAVEVRDRFGDYGLVGAVVAGTRGDALHVDTFLLSCRVLGKGVEHRILARLGELARERGLARVDVPFVPTRRNQPALDFLEQAGAAYRQPVDGGSRYAFPAEFAAAVAYQPPAAALPHAGEDADAGSAASAAGSRGDPARLARVATELGSAEQVLQAIRARTRKRPARHAAAYVAPRTPIEQAVADVLAELLRLERVGADDDFFGLGGHSILAVQVASRLRDLFQVDLPLRVFFSSSGAFTVAELAKAIEQYQIEQADPEEIAALMKELDGLSDEEVAQRLAAAGASA